MTDEMDPEMVDLADYLDHLADQMDAIRKEATEKEGN